MNRTVLIKIGMIASMAIGMIGSQQSNASGFNLGDTYYDISVTIDVTADGDQFDGSGDPYYDAPYQDYYNDYYNDQPTDAQDQGGGGTDANPPPEPCGGSCGGSFPLCDAVEDRCYRDGTNGEWRWKVYECDIINDPNTDTAGIYIAMCRDQAVLFCDNSEFSAHPPQFQLTDWHGANTAGHNDISGQFNYTTVAPNACCSFAASAPNGRCYQP